MILPECDFTLVITVLLRSVIIVLEHTDIVVSQIFSIVFAA